MLQTSYIHHTFVGIDHCSLIKGHTDFQLFPFVWAIYLYNQMINNCSPGVFDPTNIYIIDFWFLFVHTLSLCHPIQPLSRQTSRTGCASLEGSWHLHKEWLQIVSKARLQYPALFMMTYRKREKPYIQCIAQSCSNALYKGHLGPRFEDPPPKKMDKLNGMHLHSC